MEQEPRSTTSREEPTSTSPRAHTLLYGDANLRQVYRNDLANNCSVKTLHGGNVDLLRSWVPEKINQATTACVIFCGINDVIIETPSDKILDDLGSLTGLVT